MEELEATLAEFTEIFCPFAIYDLFDRKKTFDFIPESFSSEKRKQVINFVKKKFDIKEYRISFPISRNGKLKNRVRKYTLKTGNLSILKILKKIENFYDEPLTQEEIKEHIIADPNVDLDSESARYDALMGIDYALTWISNIYTNGEGVITLDLESDD
jgi:hypothetical protein